MNKTIAIAGLGWLGLPLAQKLSSLGYSVKGSVTSLSKAKQLQENGFEAYPVEIAEMGVTGEVKALLKDTECLIVMIPPGLRRNTGADYVLKMVHFLEEIKRMKVSKVILVSSTSVYDDSQGIVTEQDEPEPQTIAAKQLRQVEELFVNTMAFRKTVVRFGGLFGGSRKPARYLAGRKDLKDGNAPVNLIHREDCIKILIEIIKQDAFGKGNSQTGIIFNAVNPHHPKKSDYYVYKASELDLEPPTFLEEDSNDIFKQVDSENLKSILNYVFEKPLL